MKTNERGRWLGSMLAGVLGLTGFALSTDAEAAPTPGGQIRGQGGNFGFGLSMGDPMGPSIKWFMAPKHALQGDFGWAPLHHGHGRFGADYLYHPGTFINNDVLDLVPYFGAGTGVMFWGTYYYGGGHGRRGRYDYYRRGGAGWFIRAPILGIGIHWKKIPIDTMMEGSWSPYLVRTDLSHGDFSFKVRYYF